MQYKNLFYIAQKVVDKATATAMQKASASVTASNPFTHPSKEDLLTELNLLGFSAFYSVELKANKIIMGNEATTLRCGNVLFILYENWQGNLDGINRTQTIVPIGVVRGSYDNFEPFVTLEAYSDPENIVSVTETIAFTFIG